MSKKVKCEMCGAVLTDGEHECTVYLSQPLGHNYASETVGKTHMSGKDCWCSQPPTEVGKASRIKVNGKWQEFPVNIKADDVIGGYEFVPTEPGQRTLGNVSQAFTTHELQILRSLLKRLEDMLEHNVTKVPTKYPQQEGSYDQEYVSAELLRGLIARIHQKFTNVHEALSNGDGLGGSE